MKRTKMGLKRTKMGLVAMLSTFLMALGANAAISTGPGIAIDGPSGELFLAVFDTQRNISYTRDLGLPSGSLLVSFETSFSPDALYQTSFADSDPADLRYSVVGINDAYIAAFLTSVAVTSNDASIQFPADPQLTNEAIFASVGRFVDAVNESIPSTDVEDDLSTVITDSLSDGFYANPATFGESLGSVVGFNTGASIGIELAYHQLLFEGFGGGSGEIGTSPHVWRLALNGTLTYGPPIGLDSDEDGIADAQDNCSEFANAGQLDSNGDGFGNACDADLNDDCIVNFIDLGLLRLAFFDPGGAADFNGDGVVNASDLGVFRTLFLMAPGPSGTTTCGLNL